MADPRSRAELEAVKNQKFRTLARHAHAHAPYYANIVRERAIDLNTCTPADFPVLTKSLLMANFNDIVTARLDQNPNSSCGVSDLGGRNKLVSRS
jgi:phenylacetate-coenzyme A ligase PaaK-like adenylate-forming protein